MNYSLQVPQIAGIFTALIQFMRYLLCLIMLLPAAAYAQKTWDGGAATLNWNHSLPTGTRMVFLPPRI